MNAPVNALLTDLYQLNMMQAYLEGGETATAVFELFVRKLPARRGFLVAAPLALELGIGFIMLRKQGKLPGERIGLDYALEYGTDRIEMQADAINPGQRVVILDDLLATGGTMAAGIGLLRQAGAVVPAAAALIELSFLDGRRKLDVPFEALVSYSE